jgi:hypothetical protein
VLSTTASLWCLAEEVVKRFIIISEVEEGEGREVVKMKGEF